MSRQGEELVAGLGERAKKGTRYRYYVSRPLITKAKSA
jgi:hypothetical protein